MDDQIASYPTDAMKQTAQEIRTLLDAQWASHLALFQINSHSLTNLTAMLAGGVPGSKGQELQDQVAQWGQGVFACYQSLYAIADALENAAEGMADVDQSVKNTFQNISQA
jgi:uncharacterized protein YukE